MTNPIKTLLIANRGEIACRIIKTAQRLGIRTIAVYSDADRQGLHVRMADDALAIGAAPSSESYLLIDRIVQAAKQSGADAVHPGFGFLSENASFAAALAAENIRFVGPGVHAIEVMGDKITSKKLANEAGVNTIPGHPDALTSTAEVKQVAEKIGYPIMLKASAGGGGKGMRIAWREDEVVDRFTSAQNEARAAFGDERVFAEKYIERPRHIEIQILADQHGNCIYLGERECSIQRRHQKVIEEAPSPFISAETRAAMGQQAVSLAKAVDYHSAGTVEFIVDKNQQFYFLEMNTRLQVEHPVTECITGLDLVEQMLRVAQNNPLEITQNDVKAIGWAVEARVYAEDPDKQFLPSIGRLTHYIPPEESTHIRVDTGVFEGGEISMHYDPMIAKLIAHAADRDTAISHLNTALNGYVIRGVKHNIPFLSALINHAEFKNGNLTTGFIDEFFPDGFDSQANTSTDAALDILIAASAQSKLQQQAQHITHGKGDATASAPQTQQRFTAIADGHNHAIELVDESHAVIDGTRHEFNCDWKPGQIRLTGSLNGQSYVAQLDQVVNHWRVTRDGGVRTIIVLREDVAKLYQHMPEKLPPDMSGFLVSPMPGLLVKVAVKIGESVKAGQELAVVEAMKMENILLAERDAVVKAIPVSNGDNLAVDDIIIEFE